MSGLISRAGETLAAPSSSNTNAKKDLDGVATDLYTAATQNPKSAEKTFQEAFSTLNPERQQQLAETFIESLGSSGFDAMTKTVEGQRAMLCVYDNADCKTQNHMKAVHKSQVEFSGNMAVDYTRSHGDWKQTMCQDPTIRTHDHNTTPDSEVSNSKTSDPSATSTDSPIGGLKKMREIADDTLKDTKNWFHPGGASVQVIPGTDPYTMGTPCEDNELSVGVKTIKLFKDKDGLTQPEVKVEAGCIDANKAVKFGATKFVEGVIFREDSPIGEAARNLDKMRYVDVTNNKGTAD
ncbi:MAG: hypothetical protein P8163_15120 [Candidatus Thiodiazotropha sp.]